ncbi:serine hydrolase [Aliifodinibius sp. S!AR15-10]|uniref:serine hydrolase domain-containing protein n=1 Tax=Aliifodinibius sp. S!AR15-10 TaxID=2950437 RepID=UPI0028613FEF|nr:serine hydrolase [Aliifodinibius sp. S!AR15-10]MDR8393077.1 serine hydrolase [Aliifodinibius sp. S!AR15-10]
MVQLQVDLNNIPGAVVRVQQGDSVLHFNAYGYAKKLDYDMERMEVPQTMTTGELFDIASLTKVCATTFGVMLLVDEGVVGLEDPIHRWLPEFDTGEKSRITIRHLLTHSAGLYQWVPTYYHASTASEQYQYIAGLPLKYLVGEGRHYSDLGFMLLGEIIHRVSGKPLDEYLHKHLYKPLGLKQTTFNPLRNGFIKDQIAATSHGNPFEKQMIYDDNFGYTVNEEPDSWDDWRRYTLQGEVNDGNAWYGAKGVAGHAGLFSSASDLQMLINLLLDKGQFEGEQLISEAVIDTFLTKDRFGNGLGWVMDPAVFSAEGVPEGSFGHTGFTGTSIVVVPEYDLSIILLTNRQNVGRRENGYYFDLGPLRQAVVDEVLGRFLEHGTVNRPSIGS